MQSRQPVPPQQQASTLPRQDEDVLRRQLDMFQRGREGMRSWAEMATLCVKFFESDQWEAADKAQMKEEGKTPITLNKIRPLVRFLSGYFRQNRYEVRYKQGSDGAGIASVAEALSHVSKSIDEKNHAQWHDAEVFLDGILGGRGFYDYRLDFSKNIMGEIKETVLDPKSSIIDPEADRYEPESWQFFQNSMWMSFEDIGRLYGEEGANLIGTTSNFGSMPIAAQWGEDIEEAQRFFGEDMEDNRNLSLGGTGGNMALGLSPSDFINRQRKLIRVLECQHKQLRRGRYFIDLETGDRRLIPTNFDRERIAKIVQWARENNQPVDVVDSIEKQVRWTVTAGDMTLYDDWSPYRTMTVVPYFAYFRRGKTQGMVEDLLDPQREINKRRSVFLHIISTMANSGWMYGENDMTQEQKDKLEAMGSTPGVHIEYQKEAPKRIEPPAPPTSLEHAEKMAEADLGEIAGINKSATGELDRVQSGRAVIARQKQAIVGAESYFDNFSRTRQIKGEKILELIQDFYTEPRMFRTLGESGDEIKTWINVALPTGQIVNNVNLGTYDVVVDEAPMSDTFMNSQFNEAMEIGKIFGPEIVPADMLIDLSSMPRKDEWKARIKQQQEMAQQQAQMGGAPPGAPPGPALQQSGPAMSDQPNPQDMQR